MYDIVNYINLVLQSLNVLSCSYNNIKNKITFTRLLTQTDFNFTFNANTMNAGNVLGFKITQKYLYLVVVQKAHNQLIQILSER
jgi:hypothetical protein